MQGEAQGVRAAILAVFGVVVAEPAEETRQERHVDGGVEDVPLLLRPPLRNLGEGKVQPFAEGLELAREVAPLAELRPGEVVCLGEPPRLRLGKGVRLARPPVPERARREEVRPGDAPLRMGLRGLLAFVDRAAARVVARQRRDDREDERQDGVVARREEHAREARLQRDAREAAADVGERVAALDRAELQQFLQAFAHHRGLGRIDERERVDVAEAEVEHRQDDARERGAQDFGRGVGVAAEEVLLGIEANARSGPEASAAACALARRGLRDGLDLETLDLRAVDVARDAREARVDDGADAGDRDGRLGDVRREDDAAAGREAEGAPLLGGGERREKGDEVESRAEARFEVRERLADVALAGEEDEDVARVGEFAHGVGHGGGQVVRVRRRTVADVDREEPAGDVHDGGVEERGELRGVHRRGRDDDLEVAAAREEAREDAEEEIDVEGAFVRLVHDDRVVGPEERVGARLGEEDAVRQELDARLRAERPRVAVAVADEAADGGLELVRDALGHRDGGEAARLGDGDAAALRAAPELEHHLWELGRLAGARVAADDDDRMRAHGREDLRAVRGDGQLFGVGDRRFVRHGSSGVRVV